MFEEVERDKGDNILVFPSEEIGDPSIDVETPTTIINEIQLSKLSHMSDFKGYLQSLLFIHYNTTAVKSDVLRTELVNVLSEDVIQAVQNPLYYAAVFIDDPLVKDCVRRSLQVWEKPEIIEYIRDCLDKDGSVFESDEAMLNYAVELLPDNYVRTEDSPITYKAYRVVQLLKNVSVNQIEEEKRSSPVQTVGKAVGKVAAIKYDAARAFNEAMQEGLGENADAYYNDMMQKRWARAEKAAMEKEQDLKDELEWERQKRNEQAEYVNSYSQIGRVLPARTGYAYSLPRQEYPPTGRDFSPSIPLRYILVCINTLVLVLFLIAAPAVALMTAIGFFVATVGLLRIGKDHSKTGRGLDRVPPVLMACLGYLLVVFGLFITM